MTCVSSALLKDSARSGDAFDCSRVQIMSVAFVWATEREPCTLAGLSTRIQDVHLRKPRDRTTMADRVALYRLTLAVAERATQQVGRGAAEHVGRFPELRGFRLIGEIAQLRCNLPVLDLPEGLAAELEVVALVVDAVARITLDEDAIVGRADDVLLRDFLLGRLQRDVWHPLEGDGRPVVGVAAAVRRRLPDQVRLLARRLI